VWAFSTARQHTNAPFGIESQSFLRAERKLVRLVGPCDSAPQRRAGLDDHSAEILRRKRKDTLGHRKQGKKCCCGHG
jgi:hypothetical protein